MKEENTLKITVIRRWKKTSYTIGEVIVDGKVICNSLEPVDRGLVNKAEPRKTDTEDFKAARAATVLEKARHKPGTTAIPEGTYEVTLRYSAKFHGLRPLFYDVPAFEAVEIHEGNKVRDTHGCLVVGLNTIKGTVVKSKDCLQVIIDLMQQAQKEGKKVYVEIVNVLP